VSGDERHYGPLHVPEGIGNVPSPHAVPECKSGPWLCSGSGRMRGKAIMRTLDCDLGALELAMRSVAREAFEDLAYVALEAGKDVAA
jgi:hypothetical protein